MHWRTWHFNWTRARSTGLAEVANRRRRKLDARQDNMTHATRSLPTKPKTCLHHENISALTQHRICSHGKLAQSHRQCTTHRDRRVTGSPILRRTSKHLFYFACGITHRQLKQVHSKLTPYASLLMAIRVHPFAVASSMQRANSSVGDSSLKCSDAIASAAAARNAACWSGAGKHDNRNPCTGAFTPSAP